MHAEPVADCLAHYARWRPRHPAAIDAVTRERTSYAALEDRVRRATGVLVCDFKIARGDRVAVLGANRLDIVVLHLACARIGAILVPLNWRLSEGELTSQLEDAEPRLVIGDAALGKVPAAALRGIEAEDFDAIGARIGGAEPMAASGADSDLPSLMLFTSGTSGRPKGALLTERNLFTSAVNFVTLGAVGPDSAFLCDAPMFHVLGLVSNIRPTLVMGATLVLSPGFDAPVTMARFEDPDLGITHYFCVPQMAEMMRNDPSFDPARFAHITALFTGGAPHPPAKIREWIEDGIAIGNGYGMTETGAILGMPLDLALIEEKIASAGLPGVLTQIAIGRDDGSLAEDDEVGEIWMRGPGVTSGYWRRPEANAESFTEDGWFRSGDLGHRDADGFFYLVDRKKDMFISGGENVYPAELEKALAGHPGIAESAVIGIPDAKW
ncbi:MAG: AMP-binding protein, partial [Sphingomonadaceae bacterium]|nr:AMP-binding protein [Sphingomonadaceae bacterium]